MENGEFKVSALPTIWNHAEGIPQFSILNSQLFYDKFPLIARELLQIGGLCCIMNQMKREFFRKDVFR
jgi:hypothetical protein